MQPGDQLDGASGKQYRVERYLGEGVTSQVYQATEPTTQQTVALKLLRPELGPTFVANFWHESEILGELVLTAQAQGVTPIAVPRVRDSQRQTPPYFLALELARGTPLPRLLEEPPGWLEEREALEVLRQSLQILHLLHHHLRRTYTDLQLQNIWLERDADQPSIKIIDWNHVSSRWPESEPLPPTFGEADLMRLGAYFYRMVTGKGASERGERGQVLAQRAGSRWDTLSRGTRHLIECSLHPHRPARYPDARTFCEAVVSQQRLWETDWPDVLGQAKALLVAPVAEPAWEERIECALDMAERLGATQEQVAYYRRQLVEQTGGISVLWQAGYQYYLAEQYVEAAAKWEDFLEQRGQSALTRQLLLAQAGVELGRERFASLRPQMEACVAALDAEDPHQAERLVDKLVAQAPCSALTTLQTDIRVHRAMQVAQQHAQSLDPSKWKQAARAYRVAAEALARLPHREWLIAERGWGELERLAARLEEQIVIAEQREKLRREIRANVAEGAALLRIHLEQNPTHPGLAGLCLSEGERFLAAQQLRHAMQILEIGVLYAQVPALQEPLRERWCEALAGVREQEAQAAKGREEQSLKAASHRHAAAVEELNQLRTQVEQQRAALVAQWEAEREQMARRHQAQLAADEQAHQAKQEQVARRHQAQLAANERAHQAKQEQVVHQHQLQLAADEQAHQTEREQVAHRHQAQLAADERAHQAKQEQVARRHQAQLAADEQTHQVKLEQAAHQHREQLAADEQAHQAAREEATRQHQAQLAADELAHQAVREEATRQHQAQLAADELAHQAVREEATRQHQAQLAADEQAHQAAREEATHQHQARMTVMTQEYQTAQDKLAHQHQEQLTAESEAYRAERDQAARRRQMQLADDEHAYQVKVEQAARQHQAQLAAAEQSYQAKREGLVSQHTAQAEVLHAHHAAEILRLEEQYAMSEQLRAEELAAPMLTQVMQGLEAERWGEVLAILAHAPMAIDWTEERWTTPRNTLNARFTNALRTRLVIPAQQVLALLALMDPAPLACDKRNQQYEKMLQSLQQDRELWGRDIQALIEKRLVQGEGREPDDLLELIERLLLMAGQDIPETRAWLEAQRSRLQAPHTP